MPGDGVFDNSKNIRMLYKKRGVRDPFIILDNFIFNHDGMNSTISSIHMGGILVIFQFSLLGYIQAIVKIPFYDWIMNDLTSIIILCILSLTTSGVFNYFMLFKKDGYLDYFKRFEKQYQIKKIKYNLTCALFILMMLTFFVSSVLLSARM